SAKLRAIAAPIPELAPVTMATRSDMSFICICASISSDQFRSKPTNCSPGSAMVPFLQNIREGAMMRRKPVAAISIAVGLLFAAGTGSASAAGKYDTGASDTAIKIGQTYPLSGPDTGAAFGARAMAAYFAMLNDKGGVNGRKIDLITLDDGYSPPKTVEQTRRLVESDGVLLMFASLGTPTSEAVRPYLNNKKIPQLFLVSGASSVVDPKRYPWTMAGIPSYAAEGRIFAKYILAE